MNLKRSIVLGSVIIVLGVIITISAIKFYDTELQSQNQIDCIDNGGLWSDSMENCFVDTSMEMPEGFMSEYDGRNIVKELELEHHYNPIMDEFTKPMAHAMFKIRNMTNMERGEINQNLIFLALQNNGQLTVAQQTILDMSMLVDRPTTLCTKIKSIEYCSRLLTLETMYRVIELNYTSEQSADWMIETIQNMPTDEQILDEIRESLNTTSKMEK